MKEYESQDGTSKAQAAWQLIAQQLRAALAAKIASVEKMKAEDCESLTDALYTAMQLEINAVTFDKQVELETQRLFPKDQ